MKIDLATFTRVDVTPMQIVGVSSALMDPAGRYAYFGDQGEPSTVAQLDLATFTKDGEIVLPAGEQGLVTAAITPDGTTALFGTDRFETAADICEAFVPPGQPYAFIATGANSPDALAGGPAGAWWLGPILLVGHDHLPESTATELRRLGPRQIAILGGDAAVSAAVEVALGGFAPSVVRIAGADRFSTAVELNRYIGDPPSLGPDGQPDPDNPTHWVFVATGENSPYALAGGAIAGQRLAPVLPVGRDHAPRVVLDELRATRPDRMVLFGGLGAISAQTEQLLRDAAAGR